MHMKILSKEICNLLFTFQWDKLVDVPIRISLISPKLLFEGLDAGSLEEPGSLPWGKCSLFRAIAQIAHRPEENVPPLHAAANFLVPRKLD